MRSQHDDSDSRPAFRFSILRLMVLTAVAAGLIVYVRAIDAPAAFRIVIFAYFALLLGWAVLRLPAVFQSIRSHRRKLRGFKERRNELQRQYGRRAERD